MNASSQKTDPTNSEENNCFYFFFQKAQGEKRVSEGHPPKQKRRFFAYNNIQCLQVASLI